MGVQRKRGRREERLEEEVEQRERDPAQENVLENERPKEREATAVETWSLSYTKRELTTAPPPRR